MKNNETVHSAKDYVEFLQFLSQLIDMAIAESEITYCSIQSIADQYEMSAVELNQFLCQKHIQYRRGGVWHLNSRYANRGYVLNKTGKNSKTHLRWSSKGKDFIESLLAQDGIEKIHK